MQKEKLTQIVTFRLDFQHWVLLESAARDAGSTANDWVRDLTISTLDLGFGLTPNERLLFEQFVGTHYLLANGLQLLADDKLSSDECKKLRLVVKEKAEQIADLALQNRRLKQRMPKASKEILDVFVNQEKEMTDGKP